MSSTGPAVTLVDRIVTRHDADELTWVVTGACEVVVAGVRYAVDTRTALAIPAGVEHEVVPRPDSIVFPLLFPGGLLPVVEDAAPRVAVNGATAVPRTPALEACARVILQPGLSTDDALAVALATVRDHVARADGVVLPPLPRDVRARTVAEAILRTPGDDVTLDEWAASVHVCTKTLQRAFRETGMTFPRWRSTVRLVHGRDHLDRGAEIAAAAHRVGYSSVSAFTTAFRQQFGVTPGAYVAERQRGSASPPR
ncbi:AraC family transcriptional regulator [Curtobacterium sp. 18060]|uniref:AraC family transcriptional regulator n=1 Tax=Curtobacterium sp. 18060 TaxID=2681408 RepID=UPI001F1753E6|nr:AraC family transcriptional regulator [Curtobacterium sp. 18060]